MQVGGVSAINMVSYNRFEDWAQGSVKYATDMSGIYMWCMIHCPGNTFLFNYLGSTSTNAGPYGHKGIYVRIPKRHCLWHTWVD